MLRQRMEEWAAVVNGRAKHQIHPHPTKKSRSFFELWRFASKYPVSIASHVIISY